ncbi:MAG: radical SAM protein [Actinomycetes bacterium]
MWRDLPALLIGKVPRQVVVQITDRCNAGCPHCSMRAGVSRRRSTMPIDTALSVIDHAARSGVRTISFTGGEPLLDVRQLTRYVRFAREAGIRSTRTGTNGFMFANSDSRQVTSEAGRLADSLLTAGLRDLWINLDSADPATHERMRGLPGVSAGIERALPVFHDAGMYPAVDLGLTRALGGPLLPRREDGPEAFARKAREGLRRFFSRAVDMGFTMANVRYLTSAAAKRDGLSAVCGATSGSSLVDFSRPERRVLFAALRDVIPEFRAQIRILTPLSSVDGLAAEYSSSLPRPSGYACRGGVDFVFVDTRGHAFPCGYRGDEDLGPFATLDFARLERLPHCRLCDWECFRNPSELMGPVAGAASLSATVAKSLRGRDRRLGLWRSDVRYYLAAGLFDGRRAPDMARLRAASATPARKTAAAPTIAARAAVVRPLPASQAAAAPALDEVRLRLANPGEEMDTAVSEVLEGRPRGVA